MGREIDAGREYTGSKNRRTRARAAAVTLALVGVVASIGAGPARAQAPEPAGASPEGEQQAAPPVLRDLESKSPRALTPDEVKALMPGARVARTSARGNTVYWTNDDGGTLFATSDNRAYGSVASVTTRGKWNITDDGRYCVLIEYRRVEAEQWCGFIIKTTDGYFRTSSTTSGTSRVFKLDITK